MVDLHCHILPDMDDGPKTCEESAKLIDLELKNNINHIVFTPHFNASGDKIEVFQNRRSYSLNRLKEALGSQRNLQFKTGAEVYLTPDLLEIEDKSILCIDKTPYMLIELPWDYWPLWLTDVLYKLRLQGIKPILAHVEKYSPVLNHPQCLYDLVSSGAYAQINASSIVKHSEILNKINQFIEHNLVHVIATDTHSLDKRPPLMNDALSIVRKHHSDEMVDYFIRNADRVFGGEMIDAYEPVEIVREKKGFKGMIKKLFK